MAIILRGGYEQAVYVPGYGGGAAPVKQGNQPSASVVEQARKFDASKIAETAVRQVLGDKWVEIAKCIAPIASRASSEDEAVRIAQDAAKRASSLLVEYAKQYLDSFFKNQRGDDAFMLASLVICAYSGADINTCIEMVNDAAPRYRVQHGSVRLEGDYVVLPSGMRIHRRLLERNLLAAHHLRTRGPVILAHWGQEAKVEYSWNGGNLNLRLKLRGAKPGKTIIAAPLCANARNGKWMTVLVQCRSWYQMIGWGVGGFSLHRSGWRRQYRFTKHPLDPCRDKMCYIDSEYLNVMYPFLIVGELTNGDVWSGAQPYWIGEFVITHCRPYYQCYTQKFDSTLVAHAIVYGCGDPKTVIGNIDPYNELVKNPTQDFKQQAVNYVCRRLGASSAATPGAAIAH